MDRTGSNVHDLAYLIHRELADKLKTAKAWNSPNIHDGQNVPREHILSDKEIIELHWMSKRSKLFKNEPFNRSFNMKERVL